MHRRNFVKGTGAAGILAVFPSVTGFRFDESSFTELRRGVGTYVNKGGTIGWMVHDDAIVIVDAQFPDSAPDCLAGIQERSSRRIDYLINSHHHGDHTSGNPVFREHVEHIVAHENVPLWQRKQAMERELDEPTVADILYQEELVLRAGDETIRLSYHGRAHTSGDSIIHFEQANVAHMGDLVFNRYPAYIDRAAGATISGWMSVLETARTKFDDETLFIFGHGSSITGKRADLLYMRDFLGGLLAFAEAGIKAGKSKEEVMETKSLLDFPDNYSDRWEDGVSNGLGRAYEELEE
jgi:cyclase